MNAGIGSGLPLPAAQAEDRQIQDLCPAMAARLIGLRFIFGLRHLVFCVQGCVLQAVDAMNGVFLDSRQAIRTEDQDIV